MDVPFLLFVWENAASFKTCLLAASQGIPVSVMLHNCFWLKSTQLILGQTLHTFLTQPHVYRDYNSQTRSAWLLLAPGCKAETGFKQANEKAKTHLEGKDTL